MKCFHTHHEMCQNEEWKYEEIMKRMLLLFVTVFDFIFNDFMIRISYQTAIMIMLRLVSVADYKKPEQMLL